MKTYKISEVAKILGVSVHTLRYWDKIGLLNFIERDKNGNRVFKRDDFILLDTILCLKATGMHLRDIKHYVELCQKGISSVPERLEIMEGQKDEIEKQIEDLKDELFVAEQKVKYYEEAIKCNSLDVFPEEREKWLNKIFDLNE